MKIRIVFIFLFLALLVQEMNSVEKDYTDFVKYLQQKITKAPFKGQAYKKLAYLTDTYGPRMWGSQVLQTVIQEMKKYATEEGFQNIRLQQVSNFTKWVRRKQELTLHLPRPTPTKLAITALGGSVSGNMTAQVIVVQNFDELQKRKFEVPGKILVFNHPWVDYPTSIPYRVDGPSIAAKYGAVGMLVRSIASQSIYSVHTGYMQYDPQYPKIPCAAITVQDAQMFARMQKRGQKITLHLLIETQFVPNTNSANLVFQIVGSEKPQQIVLAGGHIDTWDTGSQTGANDDGGGFITVFEAFRMLKRLGFRPKRTLRFIAWSGQESGSPRDGSAQYLERHMNELDRHVAAFQNDEGSSRLIGFGHSGPGQAIVQQILTKYMSIIGGQKYSDDGWSADVQNLLDHGIPIIHQSIIDNPTNDYYYKYHHTAGDSMTIMDPQDMDSNVLGIASFLYIIADLQNSLREIKYEQLEGKNQFQMLRKIQQ